MAAADTPLELDLTQQEPIPEAGVQAALALMQSGRLHRYGEVGGRPSEVSALEQEFAAELGARYCVAMNSCGSTMFVALKAAGVMPGDAVLSNCFTLAPVPGAIAHAAARPVLVDVTDDFTIDLQDLDRKAAASGAKTLLLSHMRGHVCDMEALTAVCRRHGVQLIEDCAHTMGAAWNGRATGTWGRAGAWSFCQDKIISTGGEGGMVTTHDRALWSRMWSYKDHGKSWEAVYERQHPPGFRWLHESFGTNWRMLEMQAVIGRLQLERLAAWTARRRAIAERIAAACRDFPALRVPVVPPHLEHAYYRFYAYVRPERLAAGWDRDRIVEAVKAEGVPLYQGSCSEVYLEKAFDDTGLRPAQRLPNARQLGETSLMFLVHPTLTDDEVDRTCRAVAKVMDAAGR